MRSFTTDRTPARTTGPSARPEPRRVTEVGDPEPVDMKRHHRLGIIVGLVSFAAVIVVAVIGLGTLLERETRSEQVPMVELPKLAGSNAEVAQRRLEAEGLVVDLSFSPNERLAEGTVFDQLPPAGARVERGQRVELRVSDGPFGYVVPELAGDVASDSTRELTASAVGSDVVEEYDETVPPGIVLRSDPPAGRRVASGERVKLIVSKGPAPRRVPTVVGRPSPEGLVELGRLGLNLGKLTERYVRDAQPNTILELDPAGGTDAPRDSAVNVVVSGPAPTVLVPSVVGLQAASAQQVMTAAGFQVTLKATEVEAGSPVDGRVVSQSAVAGAKLPPGSALEVFVGQAPVVEPVQPVDPSGPTGPSG